MLNFLYISHGYYTPGIEYWKGYIYYIYTFLYNIFPTKFRNICDITFSTIRLIDEIIFSIKEGLLIAIKVRTKEVKYQRWSNKIPYLKDI